jgi:hypothetical protein
MSNADRGRSRGRSYNGSRGYRGRGSYSSNRGSYGSRDSQRGRPQGNHSSHRGYGGSRDGYQGNRDHTRQRYNAKPTVSWEKTSSNDDSGDIRRVLSDMSKSITMLSVRLDDMQKNRGLDKNTDNRVYRPELVKNARPPATTSSNNDFASVSKCMYRVVQLRHHEANWKSLPKSINHRLNRLADDIKPPAADDTFRSALSDLTSHYGEKIRQLVEEHLRKKIAHTEVEAGRLSRQDIERAQEVAAKYVSTRLGKRLPENRRATLLQQAADAIGMHNRPPPASPPKKQPAHDDEWTVVGSPRQQQTTRKRLHPETETLTVSNRFECLDDAHEVIEIDEQGDSTTSTPTERNNLIKKLKKSFYLENTRAGVQVFKGKKHEWHIEAKKETNTILIGDSNLKAISAIPKDWEVHCLPGAHIEHVTGVLSRFEGNIKPVNIIVHIGINHRTNVDSATDEELKDMMAEVDSNLAIEHFFIAGISKSTTLSSKEASNVNTLNEKLKQIISVSNFIPPLSDSEVEIVSTDPYGIHYTVDTADKIMKTIEEQVSPTVFW